MQKAVDHLWPFTGELHTPAPYEAALAEQDIVPDFKVIQPDFLQRVNTVIQKSGLVLPRDAWMQTGGKNGIHTEHLGYLLAEMQVLQRTYPGAEW
jgi:ring-1,2-phenylacetyl-CoA epoxidase subunit PaaC